jgi:predicted O-methyltransferase YrrM
MVNSREPLKKVRRKLDWRQAQRRGEASVYELSALHPGIGAGLHASQLLYMAYMSEAYAYYVSTISTPAMTLSLETAGLLAALYGRLRPQRVLDLGSGFSTYVASRYARGAHVVSVDDDEEWLGSTERFLNEMDVDPPSLLTLTDHGPTAWTADITFYDLGEITTRKKYLPLALESVGRAGVVVLDDLHKRPYSIMLDEVTQAFGTLYRLPHWTRDSFGRYSGIWLAPEQPLNPSL